MRLLGKTVSLGLRGVVRVRVRCPTSEQSPRCSGRLRLRTQRRVRIRKRTRMLVLASARFSLAAGETASVRLRLPRAKARLVRTRPAARRVVAIAAVRDAAANRATVSKRMRIVLPRRRPSSTSR